MCIRDRFKKLNLTAIDETNVETYEMTRVGFQAYLPEMWGSWGWTLAVGGPLLLLWYALVRYNESTEKFTPVSYTHLDVYKRQFLTKGAKDGDAPASCN